MLSVALQAAAMCAHQHCPVLWTATPSHAGPLTIPSAVPVPSQQATAHQHPVSAALTPLRLRTSTRPPAPISTACTATLDAPATSGPTVSNTPPDASDAAPAVLPSRKQGRAELQTPEFAAAGKKKNRLNLRKKLGQGFTRPLLAPLPDKLLTCAIQRSETWQQQADVYARSHSVMNEIHIAAMWIGAANALKALEVRSTAVANAAARLDARNTAAGSGSASAAAAAAVNPGPEISAANFVPYANAPASAPALLLALEADALRVLPSMGPRSLAGAVWGVTKAWSLTAKHSTGISSKDAAWTGPSVEFLEALGVATSRNIAHFNPQVALERVVWCCVDGLERGGGGGCTGRCCSSAKHSAA